MPGSQADNACSSCGRTIAWGSSLCNACSKTPVAARPQADNACSSCGRTIAWGSSLCNACAGAASASRDSSSSDPADSVLCEYCHEIGQPGTRCRKCSHPHPPRKPPPDNASATLDRSTLDTTDRVKCEFCYAFVSIGERCPNCSHLQSPITPTEGDRKRAAWARAAEARDAAWERRGRPAVAKSENECTSCGRAISPDKTHCNACSGGGRRGSTASSRRTGIIAFVALMFGSTIVAVIALTRGGDAPAPAAPAPVPMTAPVTPRPPPPTAPESPATRIANAPTFEQAIALARPALTDTTDELGPGAQLLASYKKLRWADVDVPAETTLGRVEKDPALERGKRLCATGEIQRIARRDLDGRKVYVGQLRTADGDEVAFVAVGTTGDLVKRSTATLCGSVLGMSGPAVSILGMFKLDENQLPLVEQ